MNNSNISSNIDNDVSKQDKITQFIENSIEKKINQLFDVLPQEYNIQKIKMIHDYTINELYVNTLQTVIDIINDITKLISEKYFITSIEYRKKLFNIFLNDDRKLYVGIILVIIAIVLFMIDGTNI